MTSLDIYDSEPASLGCHGDRVSSCSSSSGSGSARSLVPGRGHEPYSVDLRTLTAVGFHLVSRRFQFAFYVERCDDRPLLFAAESDLEMRCWVAALRMLADKVRISCWAVLQCCMSYSNLHCVSSYCFEVCKHFDQRTECMTDNWFATFVKLYSFLLSYAVWYRISLLCAALCRK